MNIDDGVMPLEPTETKGSWQQDSDQALDGIERFIEQMGVSSQEDGIPRIAGRILGYFIIYGGPVSFAQLADELQVSRGSVSTNARILTNFGFIERISKPGDRQDYYQLAQSPFLKLLEGYMEKMRRMQEIFKQADESIPVHMSATHERLNVMKRFYTLAVESNDQLLRQLRRSE
ncbi:MAG: hypothetical protein R3332_10700 [Pseudohongiellaceae bacterium]|nr:hypothetical protein [Pseudohongiellaceae bacterium]